MEPDKDKGQGVISADGTDLPYKIAPIFPHLHLQLQSALAAARRVTRPAARTQLHFHLSPHKDTFTLMHDW